MNLGVRLQRIRKANGITGKELELRSGVAQSTISKIEKGIHSPTIDTLEQLCSGLNIDLITLFDSSTIPDDVLDIIQVFKKLTPIQKKALTDFLKSIL